MLVNAKNLRGVNVDGSDAAVGTVEDSYFDDEQWTLKFLQVDTREWLRGRHVLVPLSTVTEFDPQGQKMRLSLTQAQVDHAPEVNTTQPNLKSARDVIGYHIRAQDETFGHLEDMLIDTDTWAIRYLLIDTRNWWPGPPVLMRPDWAVSVDWGARKLAIDVAADQIKACPPYDPASPPTREYEAGLHRHYQRRGYWQ